MKQFVYIILSVCMMFLCSVLTSCNDDSGNQPVITGVRVTNPEFADSLFCESSPGQLIVILGNNLDGAKKVYINGVPVVFETVYATNSNIIVPIPSDIPLKATNPDIPSEIRVVTDHGEAVYSFHINAPKGSIHAVGVSDYPVTQGVTVDIIGNNFYEIQSIYFTDTDPQTEIGNVSFEITDYEVSDDYSNIRFALPVDINSDGWIVVKMYSNTAYVGLTCFPPAPIVTRVSSTMPVVGTTVAIDGFYFLNVKRITFGSVTLMPEDLDTSYDGTKISFVMPPLPDDYISTMGTMTVEAAGGTVEIPFYDTRGLLVDFDKASGRWSWGASIDKSLVKIFNDTQWQYPHGTCYGLKFFCDPTWYTGDGVMSFNSIGEIPYLNDVPLGDIEVQFEGLFIDFTDTQFVLNIAGMDNKFEGKPTDIHGNIPDCEWSTYSLPLSKATYSADSKPIDQTILWSKQRAAGGGSLQIRAYVLGNKKEGQNIQFYIDNIRLVRKSIEQK